jgi:hypothetical protein
MQGLDPEFKLRTYFKSYLSMSKAKSPACLIPRDRLVRSPPKFDKQLRLLAILSSQSPLAGEAV